MERWCHWSKGDKASLKSRQIKRAKADADTKADEKESHELDPEAPGKGKNADPSGTTVPRG